MVPMVMYAKVTQLPDGGQELTIWQVSPLHGKLVESILGQPETTVLLGSEQVINAREGVGTFAAIPGGQDNGEH